MRPRLHHLIFAAMGLGVLAGLLLEGAVLRNDQGGALDMVQQPGWLQALDFVGTTLFIGALKMIVAPLILFSIVAGITSIPSFQEAGRIGLKTAAYYVGTTTVAVTIGLVLVLTIQPGRRGGAEDMRAKRASDLARLATAYEQETGEAAHGADARPTTPYLVWLDQREGEGKGERYASVVSKRDRTTFQMFVQDIVQPMLMNPFQALAERKSLGIISWALLFGLALMAVGARARPMIDFFRAGNDAVLRITHWIMAFSPLAIGCLIATMVAIHGPRVFETLGWYCGTVIGGILIHVVFLLLLVRVLGGLSPRYFLRGLRQAWAVAFATRSSAATLPVTVECVVEKLRVKPQVANFTLPVGATINMDGTALYEGVAVIFLLQIYGGMDDVGIALTGGAILVIFITAVLASVGAAAVPDAGLVTMVLVASAVGLPAYYLPFIFAVDAFLDMFRTSTNVMGDAAGAVIVHRLEHGRLEPAPT